MAQVSDGVLSWLYSVLHEYHDPQRAYSDVAQALSSFSSLRPRSRRYTYDHGVDALLVNLQGTLPANFRGTVFHFPISLWVPHAYPHETPIVYVEPAVDMAIVPGQHVAVDGRIYHPYLRDWGSMWDSASLVAFLQQLQQVFGREPPVRARPRPQQFQVPPSPSQHPGATPTPPQLPPKPQDGHSGPVEVAGVRTPPPLPPKGGEEHAASARNLMRDGPPLPPLPHEVEQYQARASSIRPPNGYRPDARIHSQPPAAAPSGYQNGRPPIPALPRPHAFQPQTQQPGYDSSPVSPISPVTGYSQLPEVKYSQPPAFQQRLQEIHSAQNQQQMHPAQRNEQTSPQYPHHEQRLPPGQSQPFQLHHFATQQAATRSSQQLQRPAPDLLSDPFDVALPGAPGGNLPAPPIPPNPEKEHLVHAISGSLVQQAQQKVIQNISAIAPLQTQQHALYAARERLEIEIRQLEQLDHALSSNEAILHRSIQDCDRTIATARSQKQPPIDDVLIAPTMVANQLWTLCAEEAACREAMYVLQKAVDRGRVSGNDFVRQMRALGRESFMKMALARKCARGMGLDLRR